VQREDVAGIGFMGGGSLLEGCFVQKLFVLNNLRLF